MKTVWSLGAERYRYMHLDDLPSVVEMLADPEVGRWLWFAPAPARAIEAYFEPLLARLAEDVAAERAPESGIFVVEDGDGRFLGEGAAIAVEGSPRGFEIGFQLARHAWGRGVGTRLSRFLCAWAVQLHDAFRLEANCLEGNVGSRRLLEKLGLQLEGRLLDYRLEEGVRHHELRYGARASALAPGAVPQL